MSYAIKEIFGTLQGEGHHAGRAAVFVRFAGCNLWNGKEADRTRDAARNNARCPLFCDTDFNDGTRMSAPAIVDEVIQAAQAAGMEAPPMIVVTGGEPFLQLDGPLCRALHDAYPGVIIAVETNGTVKPRVPCGAGAPDGVDWVCVSPKTPPADIVVRGGSEIKVVVPSYNPGDYAELAEGFDHRFIAPEAAPTGIGVSVLVQDNIRRAAAYCMVEPSWRLSLQTHKITGVP